MISVEEAYSIVLDTAHSFGVEQVPLTACIGRVLAADQRADRHLPPFDRVMMDGVAIVEATYGGGQRVFEIAGVAAAGSPKQTLYSANQCLEVMTGAPLPKGCDAVIRYEDVQQQGSRVTIQEISIQQGQNIHPEGSDHQQGDVLLMAGTKLKAIDVNVLATIGCAAVPVYRLPRVAVLSSGDELVPVAEVPESYQIRGSNAHMLAARLCQVGIQADRYHVTDDEQRMEETIQQLVTDYDVLLISGGVSKGKYDFMPEVLAACGVHQLFHRVAQRPGKPFWFGRGADCTVFAFPGNPVSTLACSQVYFVPWLAACMGYTEKKIYVRLAADVRFTPELTYFAQARIHSTAEGYLSAEVLRGNGSGDMVSPTKGDGFVVFPAEGTEFKSGQVLRFFPFWPLWQ